MWAQDLDGQMDVLRLNRDETKTKRFRLQLVFVVIYIFIHLRSAVFPSVPLNLYLSTSFLSQSLEGARCPA